MALTQVPSSMLANAGAELGMRNRIINGDMRIWQRGTSGFTTPSNYSADRWAAYTNGTLSAVAQSTDVPAGYKYSISLSGTTNPQLYQRVESINCADLVGLSVTISFWAKQTVGAASNSIAFALYTPTATDNYTSVNTVGSGGFTGSASWTYYTATVTNLPASVANGLMLNLYANNAGSATFLLTGVQLEVGSVATPFERRPYGMELALCQRYYQSIDRVYVTAYLAFAAGNDLQWMTIFPVQMRSAPFATASGWSLQNVPAPTITTTVNNALFTAVSTAAGNCYYRTTTAVTFNSEL